jgi:hypothetical protein
MCFPNRQLAEVTTNYPHTQATQEDMAARHTDIGILGVLRCSSRKPAGPSMRNLNIRFRNQWRHRIELPVCAVTMIVQHSLIILSRFPRYRRRLSPHSLVSVSVVRAPAAAHHRIWLHAARLCEARTRA